jgi:hypothetical protein
MWVLGLVAAGVVVLLVCLLVLRGWLDWRSGAEACLTEEEARENASLLTTAIISEPPVRGRVRSLVARHGTRGNAS